jgi:rhodanese-related sulfurtransferase
VDTDNLSISPSEFVQLVNSAKLPLVLDVRRQAAFEASTVMIAGARRCLPEQVAEFAQREPQRDVVVYCVYGHQVSQGAAQVLRHAGWNARYLAGGIQGGEDGVDDPHSIAQWRTTELAVQRK